jgi:translation initiation factor 3 subunit G
MSKTQTIPVRGRTDWADDEEDDATLALPPPVVTLNGDGSETIVSYRIDEAGKKIKITRRIRKTTVRHTVPKRVAERRAWSKFGEEKGHAVGPSTATTSIGEDIEFHPSINWSANQRAEQSALEQAKKTVGKDAKIKCRICGGEHWTSKCPYKDTMAPEGGDGPGLPTDEPAAGEGGPGGLGGAGGSYVPPHLRGKNVTGESMRGKYADRDDLATLRVTNLSEGADELELKELFGRWGNVTRVFLAKDRDTGRAKGFAFVSYADRAQAERACEKMDGCKLLNLFLALIYCDANDRYSWLPAFDHKGGVCKEVDLSLVCNENVIVAYQSSIFYSIGENLEVKVSNEVPLSTHNLAFRGP